MDVIERLAQEAEHRKQWTQANNWKHYPLSLTLTTEEFDALSEHLRASQQRIGELEAVVAKLPRTKDGVPITPMMTVFSQDGPRLIVRLQPMVHSQHFNTPDGLNGYDAHECYSTREAAESSLAQEQGK